MPAPASPRPAPPPLTGAHGSEIIALGATTDGLAVASADRIGGIRLWTVLDGTREPVVIRGAAPRSVALLRDGDGFAIGTLDAAGGVHLIRTSAAGAVRGRTTVARDLPASEIVATTEGLLVLYADQTLELVDAGGIVRSRLTPESGVHVDSLVARAGRVLALVQEDKQLHGRWIAIDHGARWSMDTPKLPFKIGHAVLSPAGDLLAVSRPRSLHPALIDLARGTALKVPLCVTREWPHEGGDDGTDDGALLRSDNAPLPLGFLSNKLVACSVMTSLVWWDTDGHQQPSPAGSFAVATLPLAMTDRALVAGTGPNLAFIHPAVNRFLGYGVHDLTGLRVSAVGILAQGPGQESLLLDAGLGERARFDPGRGRFGWLDLAPADDRTAIATVRRQSGDRQENAFQVAVFDSMARMVHQLLPYAAREREVAYEPATHLLASSDDGMSILLRFDPVSHTFGAPIRVGTAIAPSKLVLLDPRLSGGVAALAIDEAGDGLLVGELRDGELRPGTTVQPRTTYRVQGELRATDRAGHLYIHRADDHDDVVVFTRDVAGARLPQVAALTLRPSADGSRIAAFGSPRLVMLTGTGQVRWDTAAWSGAGLDWTSAGELVVQFPTGIARIDLETGAIADRRCGWGFGLSDQPLEIGHNGPSICDTDR
ncbi:MAG TPA: hypothetical protein VF469_23145 [Kofleriaceae bacterium]